MKLKVTKIRLDELEDFVNSKIFLENEYIPISPLRVKSYVANPHARANHNVLYLGYIDNKLVAFRSLLPDLVNTGENRESFAWSSGTWVHPKYRRQGFAEQLLNEAYADWDKKLMFTNYAPNTENLLLKSGLFSIIHEFKGTRAYLFAKTTKLVPKARSYFFLKIIFTLIDCFISVFASIRLWFFNPKSNSTVAFKTHILPDKQCYELIKNTKSLFIRGENELKWIFKHPWISHKKTHLLPNYPFTSYSKRFYYKTIKVYSNNSFVGFFLFSVRDGHLKTLYWNVPGGLEKDIARFLRSFCAKQKIEMITIYKKELADELFKRKFPFLYAKKYGQKIYSTLLVKNNSNFIIQDGDGDVIFT